MINEPDLATVWLSMLVAAAALPAAAAAAGAAVAAVRRLLRLLHLLLQTVGAQQTRAS